MPFDRQLVSSGTPWETSVGYARAVRIGPHVWVSGTTATDAQGGIVAPGDGYGQTLRILSNVEQALMQVGAALTDVVRTRLYVTDIAQWQAIGQAHGEVFGQIRPAATMVEVSRLITPEMVVEIEVDAFIQRAVEAL
ncbi:Putative aminoacrylate peracid reductase RutC [Halomicronema hongdechloris C2206]|uniref:Aminoacrylate peracid reductase RutC n=1 Tax=Halomicronema hongdechloris C2206 TaxID=1641165 RepID=A0A1Z3HIU4_9CYAN|nr:RidA family protein [Halomicronema hongdechloris]ASC70186.1 Putative aminoacrylate peracid reductase RutC [Halomicronema hongdechloris C2206]